MSAVRDTVYPLLEERSTVNEESETAAPITPHQSEYMPSTTDHRGVAGDGLPTTADPVLPGSIDTASPEYIATPEES